MHDIIEYNRVFSVALRCGPPMSKSAISWVRSIDHTLCSGRTLYERTPRLVSRRFTGKRGRLRANTAGRETTPLNIWKFHEIWIEQCDSAREIQLRYGLKAAFNYLVAEKLLNFADAAAADPDFARELPRFVARVRGLFTPQEIRTQLDRIEYEQTEYDADIEEGGFGEEDDLIIESPAAAGARARRFAVIKELLTAAELGTA